MQKGKEFGSSKPSSIIGRPSRTIRVRSFVLFSVCTFFAAIIIGRLFYLQIIKHGDYRRLVLEQMVYETTITAKRGQITDRNGVVLAANYTTERIFIDPHVMEDDAERRLVAEGLSEILDVDYDFVYGEAQKTQYRDRTIKRNVEKETADEVRQFIIDNDLSSIHLVETTSRVYPFGTLASHVIGFCGADGGRYGLEYQYDTALSGTSGKILSAKDGTGGSMPYNYETYIDAENGANLVTTIDYKIQSFLEKYLEEAAIESGCEARACGIVMDPSTGEIYAMATYPYFDLNDPYTLPDYYGRGIWRGLRGISKIRIQLDVFYVEQQVSDRNLRAGFHLQDFHDLYGSGGKSYHRDRTLYLYRLLYGKRLVPSNSLS